MLQEHIEKLGEILKQIDELGIDATESITPSLDFQKSRNNLVKQTLLNTVEEMKQKTTTADIDTETKQKIFSLLQNFPSQNMKDPYQMLKGVVSQIHVKESEYNIPVKVPSDIYGEIEADVNELEKCMNAECYRSAVILCGRILETALFRKYYEETQNDLLETAPGTGLGTVIKKLKDANVELDPAITQQIHLINQIRVHSVHSKQIPFYPSSSQTQAIILYTLDVLEKLWQ